MKRKIAALLVLIAVSCFTMTGCTEADQVSTNISKEADNFNVTRKLTVLNARTDTILLELTGTFALKNNSDNELEVIIETAEGKYQKDYVYLNNYTMYVVEDISGAEVDKYHYEINFLPEFGLKVTHDDRTLHSHKRRRQACTELAGEPDQLQDNQIIIPGQRRTRRTEGGEDWR